MLKYFDYYTLLGLKVIPLYPKSKIPIGHHWNIWDEERARHVFKTKNNVNMGLLLGDIIDIEGDTPEANEILDNLIGNYSHLCYCGFKSKHHLFLNPDKNLTRICEKGIEFRAYKHQSVVPPSIHPNGGQYKWLDETFPAQPMPNALLEFYNDIKSIRKPIITLCKRKRLPRGWIRPWCSICQQRETIHYRRYQLEIKAFATFGKKWECHKCRNLDLRNICRKLKRK